MPVRASEPLIRFLWLPELPWTPPVAAKAPVTPPVTSAVAPMAPPVKSVRTVRIQTKATPEEIAEAVRRGWRPTDQNSSGPRLALGPVAPCGLLWLLELLWRLRFLPLPTLEERVQLYLPAARLSCGAVVCIAHDGEPGEFGRGA